MGLSYDAIAASLNASLRVGCEDLVMSEERFRKKKHRSDTYVRMTRPRDVLRAGAVLHCEDRAGDHLTRIGPDDMHAEDAIRVRLDEELDDTLGVEIRFGAAVGDEGELAGFVLGAGGFEVSLGLTDPGDLGVGVDDGGDGAVVDVAVACLEVLCDGDA